MCKTCAIRRLREEERCNAYYTHRRNSDSKRSSMITIMLKRVASCRRREQINAKVQEGEQHSITMKSLIRLIRTCHKLDAYLPALPHIHDSISKESNTYLIIAETYLRKTGYLQWKAEDNILLLELIACNMRNEDDTNGMDAAIRWWNIILEEFEYEQETVNNVIDAEFSPMLMCVNAHT